MSGHGDVNEYSSFIEDKDIIIVGPAGYLKDLNLGELINSYEIIVRPQQLTLDIKDHGNRTDIMYFWMGSSIPLDSVNKNHDAFISQKIKWMNFWSKSSRYIPKVNHIKGTKTLSVDVDHIVRTSSLVGTAPTTGFIAITHLLTFPIKTLTIKGFDFYFSHYHHGANKPPIIESNDSFPLMGPHDNHKIALYMRELLNNDSRIIADQNLLTAVDEAYRIKKRSNYCK